MLNNEIRKKRNYGIDLLRIISMFYIVILHCLGQGGVLGNSVLNSVQYKSAWFLEIWAICAVNIFAIISGYVGYNEEKKKYNYSAYIVMWLQVVFYGLIVTGVFKIIKPQAVGIGSFIDMIMPVCNNLYWYFTAYTALFFVIPLINGGIRECSKNFLKKLLVVIFILFIFINNIFYLYNMTEGYSFIWIFILYIVGAIIKKCEIGKNLKTRTCILGIILLTTISWFWKLYGININIRGLGIYKHTIYSYTSPTIVVIAMLYVIGFSKLNLSKGIEKVIKFSAPCAFAIYILNNQKYIWEYVMKNRFISLCSESVFKIIVIVLLFSIVFVVLSILIDRVRILIFKVLHVKEFADNILKLFDKILVKIKYL